MPSSVGAAAVLFPLAAAVSLATSFLLVSRLERVALGAGMSEATLGLVVALAADAPEITSAVAATLHGQQSLGVGVVLGSNVFNLAALLGLGAIVARRIDLHPRVVAFEGSSATWVATVTLLVVVTGWAPVTGLLLVLVVVVPYVTASAVPSSTLRRWGVPERVVAWVHGAILEEELELSDALHSGTRRRRDGTVVLASLLVVIGASTLMERSAETVGRHFHLTDLVIGGIILAAVTSLPNAVGAVYLATRGRGPAVLSEAMNSNMLNVVVGLFLPAIFLGIGRTGGDGILVAGWYAGLTVLCLALAFAGRGLRRPAGLVIVGAYLAFVVVAVAR